MRDGPRAELASHPAGGQDAVPIRAPTPGEGVDGAFGENARRTVTILDVNDRVVAGITERRTTMQFVGNDFCDYTVEFEYPPYEPVGGLYLVVHWWSTPTAGPSGAEC